MRYRASGLVLRLNADARQLRFMEFLSSKNRLNVAVSRAKSLAILAANPALTSIKCTHPAQMGLVNTRCLIASAGRAAASAISCNRHNFLDHVDIGE